MRHTSGEGPFKRRNVSLPLWGRARAGARRSTRLVVLLSLVTLSACGFHLRGAVELPDALKVTTVEGAGAGTELGQEIRGILEAAGAEVVPVPTENASRLIVFGEEYSRRVLSVGSGGKAREYELFYRLVYSLRGPDGRVWIPEQTISMTRDYVYDEDNVLSTEQEEDALRQDMRQLGVRQMLRRVQVALRNGPPSAEGVEGEESPPEVGAAIAPRVEGDTSAQ